MRTITVLCMALMLFSAFGARLRDSNANVDASTETLPLETSNTPTEVPTPNTTTPNPTTPEVPTSNEATPEVPTSSETTPNATTSNDTTSEVTKGPTSDDVVNFLSGVWEAIGLGHDFEDFSSCVNLSEKAGTHLQKAMTLLDGKSASKISRGLNKLDRAVQPLIGGLRACNMTEKYTETIDQLINKFTETENVTIQAGASILLDSVEVYPDIAAAIAACNESSYSNCGLFIGDAMGKVFYDSQNATSANDVAAINADPNITWTAEDFPQLRTTTLWKFKKRRLNLRRKNNDFENSTESPVDEETKKRNLATIPAVFDSRTKWPGCIHAIRDQGGCGSCWAFASSDVLSDRFCISSGKSINAVMSPQYLVSCDTNNMACNGGYLDRAWRFLENNGDVTDPCLPYRSGSGFVPTCSSFTKCSDNSRMRKYYARKSSTRVFTSPAAIQQEIMTNGPVVGAMDVYSDFMSYKSGIYSPTASATYSGGHAVKIVGWGNTNGVNYWIVANSWGSYWGERGFFRIRFGACGIDKGAYSGLPDLTRS